MPAIKSIPVPELTKAIHDKFLASHAVDSIGVTAYDLPESAARSVCVVLRYPALPPRNGDPFSEYIAHSVVCRYHLKPGTDLSKPSAIRGILTRVGNDINSAYRK